MLVDVNPLYDSPEKVQKLPQATQEFWSTLSAEEQSRFIPIRISLGVWAGGLNPTRLVEEDNLHQFIKSMGNLHEQVADARDGLTILRESGHLSAYGVCDGIANLLSHPDYAAILAGPRHFTVFLTEIRREDQSEEGGWRWHKWGPYIGAYEPQYEYLYDESIDNIWLFNIVEHYV